MQLQVSFFVVHKMKIIGLKMSDKSSLKSIGHTTGKGTYDHYSIFSATFPQIMYHSGGTKPSMRGYYDFIEHLDGYKNYKMYDGSYNIGALTEIGRNFDVHILVLKDRESFRCIEECKKSFKTFSWNALLGYLIERRQFHSDEAYIAHAVYKDSCLRTDLPVILLSEDESRYSYRPIVPEINPQYEAVIDRFNTSIYGVPYEVTETSTLYPKHQNDTFNISGSTRTLYPKSEISYGTFNISDSGIYTEDTHSNNEDGSFKLDNSHTIITQSDLLDRYNKNVQNIPEQFLEEHLKALSQYTGGSY